MHAIFERAARDGVARRTLIDAFPERVPYRGEPEARALLAAHGLAGAEILRLPDCLVACRRKAAPAAAVGAAADWLIRVERVSLRYPRATRDAVHALDLAIPRNIIYGILGPNGAGKTTAMSLLAGLRRPDEGAIRYAAGLDAAALHRAVGIVPQNLALYPKLTARENLMFFGGLHGLAGRALRQRVAELLDFVGLAEHANTRVETFSGGMMRRLNLTAGLVHGPSLLLLDEPTVGIDPQSRHRIFDLVLDQKRRGATVLLTTHYLDEADRLCDHVAILDYGAVLVEGATREIVSRLGGRRLEFDLDAPAEPFVQALRQLDRAVNVTVAGRVVSVGARDGDSAMELLKEIPALAARCGARLALRRVAEPTLESVFLDLTGRSVRDMESA